MICLSQMEGEHVICLSQTERKVTNSGAEGRDAIILTHKTNKWEELLRHNICLTSVGKNIEEKKLSYNTWN